MSFSWRKNGVLSIIMQLECLNNSIMLLTVYPLCTSTLYFPKYEVRQNHYELWRVRPSSLAYKKNVSHVQINYCQPYQKNYQQVYELP